MPGIVSINEAVLGPYKALSTDATLISASYLNGANKIFKGPHRRDNVANPTLHMRLFDAGIAGDQDQVFSWLLRLHLYLAGELDYNVNINRAGLIEIRIAELLNGKVLTGAAGVTYLNCRLAGAGMALPIDETNNTRREHQFVFSYYLDTGKE